MKIDQFLSILLAPGDGIADHARAIRDYVRQLGHSSEIYVNKPLPETAGETLSLASYTGPHDAMRIVHYSDAALVDFVVRRRLPIRLLYQNITPAEFYIGFPGIEYPILSEARARLNELIPFVEYAAGNSRFSTAELVHLGFARTGTFLLNTIDRLEGVSPAPELMQALKGRRYLLFVGRLAPNKRQDELVRLLWCYRQLDSDCELYLVGRGLESPYGQCVQALVRGLGLEPFVHFTSRVPPAELAAYYSAASAFVSTSEHEGFGIPLIESMSYNVPVVAFASTAVTEVVQSAGVLMRHKHLEEWAVVIHRLICDRELYNQVVAAQRLRLADYSREKWERSVRELIGLEATSV